MFDWFNARYFAAGTILVIVAGATFYHKAPHRAIPGSVHPTAPLPSLPIYLAYTGVSSLPNSYIDKRLGFVPHFIAFTFNWDLLNQCLQSLHQSKVGWRNVIIVDNSVAQLAVKKRYWLENRYGAMIITILPTFSFFSFSHLQNLFLTIAQQSKCKFYSWSHMDIVLLPFQEEWRIFQANKSIYNGNGSSLIFPHTTYNKFLDSIQRVNDTEKNWGLIFYAYDLLAAVQTNAYTTTGPFDISIPQYKADCDYYTRLELKGYQKIQKHIVHVFHMPDVLDRKLLEEIKTCEWPRAKEILHTAAINSLSKLDRTKWRLRDMRRADLEAVSILTPAGWTYFRNKWGTDDCKPKSQPNWNLDPVVA